MTKESSKDYPIASSGTTKENLEESSLQLS
jgi:hypothetical protein